MTLDPQAAAHLARQAALGLPPYAQMGHLEARRLNEEGAAALAGPGEDVQVRDTEIAGIPVRLYAPHGVGEAPTLIYFHGGGWVLGSVRTHDRPCRALSARVGCRVVSVGYRLAPEHRFPAAVEDCWAVTASLLAGRQPVAVGGDSAGGNLAAVVALRARDRGLPLRLQLLIYPVTDCDLDRPSYLACATGYGLSRDSMRWFWEQYLGDTPWDRPEASPLRAPSLAGAAPALVMVCQYDPLRDEGVAYAERLRQSGVPVELLEQQGMIHGFFRQAAVIDRAIPAYDQCATALRRAFGGPIHP
jgi:acetyl esterase